jgi:hypothetical protein
MASTSTTSTAINAKVELLQFVFDHLLSWEDSISSYISYVGIKDGVFCAEISRALVRPIPNGPMNSWDIIIPMKPFTNEILLDEYGFPLTFIWGSQWFEWVDQRMFDSVGNLIGYKV